LSLHCSKTIHVRETLKTRRERAEDKAIGAQDAPKRAEGEVSALPKRAEGEVLAKTHMSAANVMPKPHIE
jgi:hypothetical protein